LYICVCMLCVVLYVFFDPKLWGKKPHNNFFIYYKEQNKTRFQKNKKEKKSRQKHYVHNEKGH
jgi:hypothetical protein